MDCLRVDRLYLYLEGEFSPEDASGLEAHLAVCAACREALAERRRLVEAAETLPAIEVPADFSRSIMARLAPAPGHVHVGRWLAAAAAGWTVIGLAIAAATLLSGGRLSQLLVDLNRGFWNYFQGMAFLAGKVVKLAVIGLKIVLQVAARALDGVKFLTSLIGPEVQIAIVITALLLITAAVIFSRKLALEKNHED
jgi:predicted anti-sigma-YlaC factor YlaD